MDVPRVCYFVHNNDFKMVMYLEKRAFFVEEATENKNKNENNNENEEKKDSTSKVAKAIKNIKIAYNNIQVNGVWFLWKLYLSELFESHNNVNIALVYSCSLPKKLHHHYVFYLQLTVHTQHGEYFNQIRHPGGINS